LPFDAFGLQYNKISEGYDQLTNQTLKKVRAISWISLLKNLFGRGLCYRFSTTDPTDPSGKMISHPGKTHCGNIAVFSAFFVGETHFRNYIETFCLVRQRKCDVPDFFHSDPVLPDTGSSGCGVHPGVDAGGG